MKYVQYQVQGAGIYKAGPYSDSEAQEQLDDIAGFGFCRTDWPLNGGRVDHAAIHNL